MQILVDQTTFALTRRQVKLINRKANNTNIKYNNKNINDDTGDCMIIDFDTCFPDV